MFGRQRQKWMGVETVQTTTTTSAARQQFQRPALITCLSSVRPLNGLFTTHKEQRVELGYPGRFKVRYKIT